MASKKKKLKYIGLSLGGLALISAALATGLYFLPKKEKEIKRGIGKKEPEPNKPNPGADNTLSGKETGDSNPTIDPKPNPGAGTETTTPNPGAGSETTTPNPGDNTNPPTDPTDGSETDNGENVELARTRSQFFINKNQQVNYVAFGDSISAGFDGTMPRDYQGELINGEIEGFSFPAYLAKFIQEAESNKLAYFKNFAISGSTFNHWIAILSGDLSILSEKELEKAKRIFKSDLIEYGNSIKNKLKKANLLTVTLGANDILGMLKSDLMQLPIIELIKELSASELNYSEVVAKLTNAVQFILDKLAQREEKLIEILKEINPNLNINLVSYPLPMANIFGMLDVFVSEKYQIKFQISQMIISILNKTLQKTALQNRVFFIDSYNAEYWIPNTAKLTPLLYDIHPSIFGYKKMAMDIFAKLILNTNDLTKINEKGFNWGEKFFNSDFNSSVQEIGFKKNPLEIFETIFGQDQEQFLNTEDSLIKDKLSQRNKENYYERVISESRFADALFKNAILSFFKSATYTKYDPEHKLEKFLSKNDGENLDQLYNWMIENQIVSSILRDSENEFYNTDWNKDGQLNKKDLTFQNLLTAFKNQATKESRVVRYVASIFNIPFLKTSKEEVKEIFKTIFTNVVQVEVKDSIIDKIVEFTYTDSWADFISKDDYKTALNLIFNDLEIRNLIGDLFIAIINNSENFANATTYSDLLNAFANNEEIRNTLARGGVKIINSLLTNNEFKQIISRTVSKLLQHYNFTGNLDENVITKFAYKLISAFADINQNTNLVEFTINALVNSLGINNYKEFNGEQFKAYMLEKIKMLFNSDNINDSLLSIIKSLAKQNFAEDLDTFEKVFELIWTDNRINLKSEILNQLIPLIKKLSGESLTDEKARELANSILNSDKLAIFVKNVLKQTLNINYEAIKDFDNLMQVGQLIANNFVANGLYDQLGDFLEEILEDNNVQTIITDKIEQNAIIKQFLDTTLVTNIIKAVINDGNLKNIVQNFFVNGVFNSNNHLTDLTNLNKLIKVWLSNDENKALIVNESKNFAKTLLNNETVIEQLGISIYRYLLNNSSLVQSKNAIVSQEEFVSLFKATVDFSKLIITNTNIVDQLASLILDQLAVNGLDISINAVVDKLSESFSLTRIETMVVDIYKQSIKNGISVANRKTIKKLILNSVEETKLFNVKKLVLAFLAKQLKINAEDNRDEYQTLEQLITESFNFNEFKRVLEGLVDLILDKNFNSVKDFVYISDITNAILHNYVLSNNYNLIVSWINKVLNSENFASLYQRIITSIRKRAQNYISLDIFKFFTIELLKNVNFKNILNSFINDTIANNNIALDEALNYEKIIVDWAKINKELLLTNSKAMVNSFFFENELVRKTIWDWVKKLFKEETNLLDNISDEAYDQTVENASEMVKNILMNQNVFENLFNLIYNEFTANGFSFNIQNFKREILSNLNDEVLTDIIVTSYKSILGSNLYASNKATIIQFVHNLLLEDKIFKFLQRGVGIVAKLFKIDPNNEILIKTYKDVVNSDEDREFITALLDKIFSQPTDLSQIRKIKDIVNHLLSNLTDSVLYDKIILLINKIFENPHAEELLAEKIKEINNPYLRDHLVISNFKLGFNVIVKNQNFKDLLNDFGSKVIANINNLTEILDNGLVLLFKWIGSQENREFITTKFNNLILDTVKNSEVKKSLIDIIIKKFDKYQWATDVDRDELRTVFNSVYDYLTSTVEELGAIKPFINTVLETINNTQEVNLTNLVNAITNSWTSIFNEEKVVSVIIKFIKSNVLSDNKEIIKKVANSLFKSLLTDSINNQIATRISEYSNGILDVERSKAFLNQIYQDGKFEQFVNATIEYLINKKDTDFTNVDTYYELVDKLLTNITNLPIYDSFVELISAAFKKENVRLLIPEEYKNKFDIYLANVTDSQLSTVFNLVLKNSNFKLLVDILINQIIFTENGTFENLKNFNQLLINYLSNVQNKEEIKVKVSTFIDSIFASDELKNLLFESIYQYLKNEQNWILTGVEKAKLQAFYNALITNLSTLSEKMNLKNSLVSYVIDKMAISGYKLNYQEILSWFTNEFFSLEKFEKTYVNFIKAVVNLPELRDSIPTAQQIFVNIANYVLDNTQLVDKLWLKLPDFISRTIGDNFTLDNAKSLLKKIVNSSELAQFIQTSLDGIFVNPDSYQNATTFADLITIYLNNEDFKTQTVKNSKNFVFFVLRTSEIKSLIKTILDYNISKYPIDTTSDSMTKLINDLIDEIPNLLDNLKLLEPITEAIIDYLPKLLNKETANVSILDTIQKAFNFADYNIIKVILNSQTLNQNKETFKTLLLTIFNQVTQNDEAAERLIKNFMLDKAFDGVLDLSPEETTQVIKSLLRSDHLNRILTLLINEVIDNNVQYGELENWKAAFNKFFSSSSAQEIKSELKLWIKEILTENTDVIGAIGSVVTKKLKDANFDLNNSNDKALITQFIGGALKGFITTRMYDDMIDAMFESLKNMYSYNKKDYVNKLINDMMSGALKVIKNDKGKISLSKILENYQIFDQIIKQIDNQVFVSFINRIFAANPITDANGNYTNQIGIFKYLFQPKNSNSGNSNFEVESGAIWSMATSNSLNNLLYVIWRPLVTQYLKSLKERTKFTNIKTLREQLPEYHAIFRIYASLAQFLYKYTPNGLFWNGTNTTAEAYLYGSLEYAFNQVKSQYRDVFTKYNGSLHFIGFRGNVSNPDIHKDWWAGAMATKGIISERRARSNHLGRDSYAADHVLVYIYYPNAIDSKYNGNKTFNRVLVEALHRGYLIPVQNRESWFITD